MIGGIAALLFLLFSAPALAQDVFPPRQTTAPQNARFEVLSSSVGGNRTYRINRWTGQVDEVDTRHPTPTWRTCEIRDIQPDDWNTPRYHLVTTGAFSNTVLLVDTLTGRTWIETFEEVITPERKGYRTVWVPLK